MISFTIALKRCSDVNMLLNDNMQRYPSVETPLKYDHIRQLDYAMIQHFI